MRLGEKFGVKSENEEDYGRNTEDLRKKCGRNVEEIVAWMLLEPEIIMEEIAQRIDKSQRTTDCRVTILDIKSEKLNYPSKFMKFLFQIQASH